MICIKNNMSQTLRDGDEDAARRADLAVKGFDGLKHLRELGDARLALEARMAYRPIPWPVCSRMNSFTRRRSQLGRARQSRLVRLG
jgi:hypothetical protein